MVINNIFFQNLCSLLLFRGGFDIPFRITLKSLLSVIAVVVETENPNWNEFQRLLMKLFTFIV